MHAYPALVFTALALLRPRRIGRVVALLTGLMVANALADIAQFRWPRRDVAFFYLFPYWVVLAIFY